MGQTGQDAADAELIVACRPLCASAFAPFGEVIEHAGTSRRHLIDSAYETDGSNLQQTLWVSRLVEVGRLPLAVKTMERHPHSAQIFSPLSCSKYLVAVCRSFEDGSPDINSLCAFIARNGQGVVYHRNVWHHPMVAIGGSAVFVISMAKGHADDDVYTAIDQRVTIVGLRSSPVKKPDRHS